MEPFSIFGLQAEDFFCIVATTTEICTEGRSTFGHPSASQRPSRTLLLVDFAYKNPKKDLIASTAESR